MLRISQDLVDAMVAHARADHPDEACGVIAGPDGSDRPERFIPMVNAARSPTFYEFDSTDLLRLYRDMDNRDEVPVVIYHSHTATEAYPSRTDVSYASEPDAHYVLVSTRETGTEDGPYELRSYRIVDGARDRGAGRDRAVLRPGSTRRRRPFLQRTCTCTIPNGRTSEGFVGSRHASRGSRPHDPAHVHRRREGRLRRRCLPARGRPGPRLPLPRDRRADRRRQRAQAVRQRLPQRRGRALPRRAADAGRGRRLDHDPAGRRRRRR